MAKGQKMGALWIKEQRGGGTYMTGEVEMAGVKRRIVVFGNSFRTESNRQPHYVIYEETQQPAAERESAPPAGDMSTGPDRW
jgi:hypothetical protein